MLDLRIEQEITRFPMFGHAEHPRESAQVTAVSVDSAWLKHCVPARGYGRQVNIAAGRATLADGGPKYTRTSASGFVPAPRGWITSWCKAASDGTSV